MQSLAQHPGRPPVTAPPDEAAVRTDGLAKTYPGGVAAVQGLGLTVRRGEVLALLGPNGAGKSTTVGMLTTSVVPTAGRAWVAGVDVVTHPALARRNIGVVPQHNTLDRSLNVRENLAFHGRFFGMRAARARSEADALLERVALTQAAGRPVAELSGGMAQRLMIARAIMHHPAVLFLDEPTAGLDPQSRIALHDLVRELNASGQTILLITFQGIFAVGMPLIQEFGYTREIEDRALSPLPVALVAFAKVIAGTMQGLLAALVVFPLAFFVPSSRPDIDIHWAVLLTLAPLAALMCSSLGLFIGTVFDPRTVTAMAAIILTPLMFLGCTLYPWRTLGTIPWVQALSLANPLTYASEGFRAAVTPAAHLSLLVIYPVLAGFTGLLLWQGIRHFQRRIVS
jgi:ABC-type Na+ transport system ATPase subunit NatA